MINFTKPMIMGILNVTPDSFSDGGAYPSTSDAVAHAEIMARQGADIIDIGGESTRPGAERVSAQEQIRRVVDVVGEVKRTLPNDILISIDTTLSEVAETAITAGASVINDVTAGTDDKEMLNLAADKKVPICLMHMQGRPNNMQNNPQYDNVLDEVLSFLLRQADKAKKAGVDDKNIIIDPGIGFGKTTEHNLILLKNLKEIVATGYLVMLGASRKRFMGDICNVEESAQRIPATCATTALGVLSGAHIFRVHDIWQNRQALDVAWNTIHA
jgi:dihydropteroate synthase